MEQVLHQTLMENQRSNLHRFTSAKRLTRTPAHRSVALGVTTTSSTTSPLRMAALRLRISTRTSTAAITTMSPSTPRKRKAK